MSNGNSNNIISYTYIPGVEPDTSLEVPRFRYTTYWKIDISQTIGTSEHSVMSQVAVSNLINVYNVSKLYPSDGITSEGTEGGAYYTLQTAITKLASVVTSTQRSIGTELIFLSSDSGVYEKYRCTSTTYFATLNGWYKENQRKVFQNGCTFYSVNGDGLGGTEAEIKAMIRDLYISKPLNNGYIERIYGTQMIVMDADGLSYTVTVVNDTSVGAYSISQEFTDGTIISLIYDSSKKK